MSDKDGVEQNLVEQVVRTVFEVNRLLLIAHEHDIEADIRVVERDTFGDIVAKRQIDVVLKKVVGGVADDKTKIPTHFKAIE